MPAGFFATGAVDVFVGFRNPPGSSVLLDWAYLGTAESHPDVEAVRVGTPVPADANAPGKFQVVFGSESHRVSVAFNRLDHATWNRVKGGGPTSTGRRFKAGKLVLHATDFELALRYSAPTAGVTPPAGAPNGRRYFSAILLDYRESYPQRVQDVAVLFECNPLYEAANKEFRLFTEDARDLPTTPVD